MPEREHYSIGNAIADIGQAIGQDVSRYHALPPLKKARFRAGGGAGLIAFGLAAAVGRPGIVFDNLVSVLIWAAVLGFGGLWLYVGVIGARSPRDILSAVWSSLAVTVFGFLAFVGVRLLDGSDANFFLEAFFVAGLVGSAVRLWVAVRGLPGAGLDEVKAQQAHGRARDATAAEAAARLGETAGPPPRQFRD